MKLDFFQDQTINAIQAYMDRLMQRQKVVASNIANIDTPGYKTKDISFHATMEELLGGDSIPLQMDRPEHKGGWIAVRPQTQAFEVQGLPLKPERNNVDLDREMMNLSETSLSYSLISQMLRGKFRILANSINGGGTQ